MNLCRFRRCFKDFGEWMSELIFVVIAGLVACLCALMYQIQTVILLLPSFLQTNIFILSLNFFYILVGRGIK